MEKHCGLNIFCCCRCCSFYSCKNMFYRFCIRLSFENMCCCCCCLLQWRSSSYCKYSSLVYILYKLRSWPKYNVHIIYKPFIRPNDSLQYLCPFQRRTYSCLLMSVSSSVLIGAKSPTCNQQTKD